MKLSEILALRPQGTDAASISTAINRAEAAREAALVRADQLERQMAAALLTASDEEMEASERDASEAKRAADRITALLGEMRTALAEALAREQAEADAALVAEALRLDAAFVKAWDRHFVPMAEAAAKIVAAQRQADAALDKARGCIGGAPLPRHAEQHSEGMHATMYLPGGRMDRAAFVALVAQLAPSEIERQRLEADARDALDRQRRNREEAERQARAAEHRAAAAAEHAEDERRRQAQMLPSGIDRAPVVISPGGW